jgi:hypothetical protein
MPAKSKWKKAQVLKLVKESIRKWDPPEGWFHVEVIDKDVKQRDYWWYVPVYPSREPKRSYHLSDVLADVATELEDKRKLFVQFIPT